MKALLTLAIVLVAARAPAFEKNGHDAIEARAYRKLLESRVQVASGQFVEGREILGALIARGILTRPLCWGASPDTDEHGWCARRDRAELRPVPRSGVPDVVMLRQFDRNQCFHFMARPDDVLAGEPSSAAVPPGLRTAPYRRCMALVNGLLNAAIEHPLASARAELGTYALMHAIGDSYSAAHVGRNEAGEVTYLKPWALLSWYRYLFEPRGWAYHYGETHHAVLETRDAEHFVASPVWKAACLSVEDPYAVPEACFSPLGIQASQAIFDLLVALYELATAPRETRPHETRTWRTYAGHHLRHATLPPERAAEFIDLEERLDADSRDLGFGLGFRMLSSDEFEASFIARGLGWERATNPFGFSGEGELAWRRQDGADHLGVGFGFPMVFPMRSWLAVGLTPLHVSLQMPLAEERLPLLLVDTTPLQLDFLVESFWVQLGGPRYLWMTSDWEVLPRLTVGWTFGHSLGGETAARERTLKAWQEAEPEGSPGTEPWKPAPDDGLLSGVGASIAAGLAFVAPEAFERCFSLRDDCPQPLSIELQIPWDRRASGEGRLFGVGIAWLARLTQVDTRLDGSDVRNVGKLFLRTWAASPVAIDLAGIGAVDREGTFLGAHPGLLFQRGSMIATVDLPGYDTRHGWTVEPVALRLGLSFRELPPSR